MRVSDLTGGNHFFDLMSSLSHEYTQAWHHHYGGSGAKPRMPLGQYPTGRARWFTETMRDLDLFVAVAAATHDPAFPERTSPVAQSELSATIQVRADLLSRLLPRLGLADRASVDGRYVRVRGVRSDYDIHLGSGNVFIRSGKAVAVIVEGITDVALPFEGDATLARIVALIRLFACDDQIADPELLRQLTEA